MSKTAPSLVWIRNDLRVSDQPALDAAAASGRPVICLFILDEETPGLRPYGGASRWWLHHSLKSLAEDLSRLGARLTLRRGQAKDVIDAVVAEAGAEAVYWNRCYDPASIERDTAIKSSLTARGLEVTSFNGTLLRDPWELKTKAGGWFKVYTRFWQAGLALGDPIPPSPAPTRIEPGPEIASDRLEDWGLLPTAPDWAGGLRSMWQPGSTGAWNRLRDFLDAPVQTYDEDRNFPAKPATSGLAAHLRFGEISPREIWHYTVDTVGFTSATEPFLKEVVWREFAYHLLFHFDGLTDQPLNPTFARFPWEEDAARLKAWQRGQTGYPMVDAGMRELWHTGTMHNRVRMLTGSFLVKHLLQPWQSGEKWFWDTLVDADAASNPFNWQWVAGCGADASPYFRIFNPILQGEKFDPEGTYVRTWVPELAELPKKYIHAPWTAPPLLLREAGITLGKNYPEPIVDHGMARTRALAAFKGLKQAS